MLKGETYKMLLPENRAAAIETRRRNLANKPRVGAPQVFVVRLAVDRRFAWELRRFGSIVMSRSVETYGSAMLAKTAGERALANIAAEAEVTS